MAAIASSSGQDAGDGEEAGLHDRVDADAHAGVLGHLVGVDHVELQLLVDDRLLDLQRQLVPDLIRPVGAVQQERRSLGAALASMSYFSRKTNWWQAMKLAWSDQVGLANGPRAETQVDTVIAPAFLES